MKNKQEVSISDLRDNLKEIMKKEIEGLSNQLEALEPKDRLNFVIKLMPYVFPKVETVSASECLNWNLL